MIILMMAVWTCYQDTKVGSQFMLRRWQDADSMAMGGIDSRGRLLKIILELP